MAKGEQIKDIWKPSSADLNSLNYTILVYVEAKACGSSVDSLKPSITEACASMTEDYVMKVLSILQPPGQIN